MLENVTGGVIAPAGAGHRHTAGGVGAAVLGRVQLPAELTGDGEREVGLRLSRLSLREQTAGHTNRPMEPAGLIKASLRAPSNRTHQAVNPLPGSAGEASCFLVRAVVVESAVDAVSGQASTQTPTGTLSKVGFFICRRR